MDKNKVIIATWKRNKDELLPKSMFNDLHKEIVYSMEQEQMEPLYIDRNIAVFDDCFYGAFYEKDLEITEEDGGEPNSSTKD